MSKEAKEALLWMVVGSAAIVFIFMLLAGCSVQKPNVQDRADIRVMVYNEGGNHIGHGSGFVLDGGNMVITASHVVEKEKTNFKVVSETGRVYEARLLWLAKDYDVAALEITDGDFATARLNCNPPIVGASIYALGNPMDFKFVRTGGTISSAVETFGRWIDGFVMDLTVAPGSSGGAVHLVNGDVAGIVTGMRMLFTGMGTSPSGYSIAVPAQRICKLLGRA